MAVFFLFTGLGYCYDQYAPWASEASYGGLLMGLFVGFFIAMFYLYYSTRNYTVDKVDKLDGSDGSDMGAIFMKGKQASVQQGDGKQKKGQTISQQVGSLSQEIDILSRKFHKILPKK